MAEFTKRKVLGFLSFLVSLIVTWITGATGFARENPNGLSQVEQSSWQQARERLGYSQSSLFATGAAENVAGSATNLTEAGVRDAVVMAYGGESISQQLPGTQPQPTGTFVPKKDGAFVPTEENERLTLERMLNIRVRVQQEAERCESRAKRGDDPYRCIADVLEDFQVQLEREASRGSAVARAAAPIVEQMASEVRQARSQGEAVAAIQRGIGKVQQIRAVRSQDIVIANRQRQQRAVLTDTLQSVEVSLVKAVSI